MRANQFINILRVDEIAHLTAGVDPVHWLAGERVPETNAAVSCTSARAHGTVLMRRPCDSLDSGDVVGELGLWLRTIALAPDDQFVVVAS